MGNSPFAVDHLQFRAIAFVPSEKLHEYDVYQSPALKRVFCSYKAVLSFPEGWSRLNAIALFAICPIIAAVLCYGIIKG